MIADGTGELVVIRRPDRPTAACMYAPCSFCLAFCHKKTIHVHMKQCKLRRPHYKFGKKSFEEGTMLLENYIPRRSRVDERIESLLEGMRKTCANEGLCDFHRLAFLVLSSSNDETQAIFIA